MLLFTVGSRIKGAEAQDIDSSSHAQVKAAAITDGPYEWAYDHISGVGHVVSMGGETTSGDALRVRFDPKRGCHEAEAFTTFIMQDAPEDYVFDRPRDILINMGLAGFGGIDTDRIETFSGRVVSVFDMRSFKVAVVSLGFRDIYDWTMTLHGQAVKFSVGDTAPALTGMFKSSENLWDIGFFFEGLEKGQSECKADTTNGGVVNVAVQAKTQKPSSPFMDRAVSKSFGHWADGRFNRFIFNRHSAEPQEEESSDNADSWKIEFFGETMIMVTMPGQVTHGDRLSFRFNPKADCDQAEMITSFYSVEGNPNFVGLEDKVIGFKFAVDEHNVLNKADSTTSAGGTVVAASSFLAGHRAFMTFGFLPVEYWRRWMDGKSASLDMLEGNGIVPEAYFDITDNSWGLDGFVEKISKASEICHGSQTVERT
jgi:hypothetical protein